MIRSILLPLAEGPLAASARDYAFWLAKKEGSRIHALGVIDIKAFEIPVLGTTDGFIPTMVTPPLQESQGLLDEMTSLARERLEQFALLCASRKIPCSVETKTGVPGEIISHAAVAHDIVVMSRTGYSRSVSAEDKIDALVTHVLRDSIRPVMVVGQDFDEAAEVHTLMVAYDGSGHAGRALPLAAELGARPGVRTVLVTIATSEESGRDTLAPAELFLCNHGVIPERKLIVGGKPSELICDLVSSARADILIMGAYGHSPIREMLFGSTTERVLSHCGTAVILQS